MLPQKNKVSRKIFSGLVHKKNTTHGQYLTLRVFQQEKGESRFSFIISKKINKKAVIRNLYKRRAYAIIQKYKNQLLKSFVCIFFFKKEAINLNFKDLEKEIFYLLKKNNI